MYGTRAEGKSNYIRLSETKAKPNDGIDDTKIIQESLNKLRTAGGTLEFESGVYNINEGIRVDFSGSNSEIIIIGNGAKIKAGGFLKYILYFVNKGINNDVKINNLMIDGSANKSIRDKFFDSTAYTFGVRILEFQEINISNCIFSNIYGTGLRLQFRSIADSRQLQMTENFEVSRCQFYNCSGLKATTDKKRKTRDNYGDGCSIFGGKSGVIKNCKIYNNLDEVGKIGRAGFATFGNSLNIQVLNDTIIGYDRAVHIENTYGGHRVQNCLIRDCNVGLIINAYDCPYMTSNPITFTQNHIEGTTRDRSVYGGMIKPASMITFIGSSSLYDGSVFSNNYIKDGLTGEEHYTIIMHQNALIVDNNHFVGSADKSSTMYIEKRMKSFTGNEVKDYNKVYLRAGADAMKNNSYKNVTKEMIKK